MVESSYKPLINILRILAISSCIVLFLYMTVFRWVDSVLCIASMARKVDAPSTIDGIEAYILTTALPGMGKEEVLKGLEKLGPVEVSFQSSTYPPDKSRDTIFINSCMHPFNNLEIYAFYGTHDELISVHLLNLTD